MSYTSFKGDDKALIGIVLSVLTFWLFAQSTLNIGPDMATDLGMSDGTMNIAVVVSRVILWNIYRRSRRHRRCLWPSTNHDDWQHP